ncbi:MAG: hypothetical protein M3217_12425, partial [Actinomycetota bacterium]|nr:hypothetical protein [Actinomycetota bacterium]
MVVLGLLLVPASAQADPVRAKGCTLKLTRTGSDTANFSFVCGYSVPIIIAAARTNNRATVTPPVLRTGGFPNYSCAFDPTSGPGDPFQGYPFYRNSFGCQLVALLGNRAQGRLKSSDVCGRRPLRVTSTLFLTLVGPVLIEEDVRIQGCPAEEPPRRRRPRPKPPQEEACT